MQKLRFNVTNETEEAYFNRTYWNYRRGVVLEYESKAHLNDPLVKPTRIISLQEARKELKTKMKANTEIKTEEVELKENNNTWIQKEYFEVISNSNAEYDGERLETLTLEENRVTSFEIDVDTPFRDYDDATHGVKKKILTVIHDGERKNLWLNVKNPLYSDIVKRIHGGQYKFAVMRTGKAMETRYNLVEQ